MIDLEHEIRDAQKFYAGQKLIFPRRSWFGRMWQRFKVRFRIGGYLTVTKVDYDRGIIHVK